ncbi:MAG: bifunctional nicotinamidase/pyrazinamidase [Promethearchaeota archaeon]
MMNIDIEKIDKITKNDALLIVDMQYDFIPGGALPVEGGDLIINGINSMAKKFKMSSEYIVFSQDWHPPGHLSFASSHPGKNPGDEYRTQDGAIGPILWPDHCVQGTLGAEFHKDLDTWLASVIIRKGTNSNVDSYSAFLENDKKTETGLAGYLKSTRIERIYICGLALDYCCYFSAMDAVEFGFKTYFLLALSKGINLPTGNIDRAIENMVEKGIKFVNAESF